MAKNSDNRCPAVRLADEMNRKAKEIAEATKRLGETVKKLESKHKSNIKAMRKVADELRLVMFNPDNIIQGPDDAKLDWCLNVLNNPEE